MRGWSPEGRGDGGVAYFPVLTGWTPLTIPDLDRGPAGPLPVPAAPPGAGGD